MEVKSRRSASCGEVGEGEGHSREREGTERGGGQNEWEFRDGRREERSKGDRHERGLSEIVGLFMALWVIRSTGRTIKLGMAATLCRYRL